VRVFQSVDELLDYGDGFVQRNGALRDVLFQGRPRAQVAERAGRITLPLIDRR
jgi:hypothetical protein